MAATVKPTTRKPATAKPPASKTGSRSPQRPAAKAGPRRLFSPSTPILEWIAAGIGLVLVLATLAMIGAEGLMRSPSPPAVTAEVTAVHRTSNGWLAEIRARNGGGAPAAAVTIEGVLTRSGAAPETAEASFDFLPARSDRRGGLYFSGDPRAGALTLRAKGYADP